MTPIEKMLDDCCAQGEATVMTEALPPTSRQLVKDGEWRVPPRERPQGWETMSVRETVERTETHTLTTREAILPAEIKEGPNVVEECACWECEQDKGEGLK